MLEIFHMLWSALLQAPDPLSFIDLLSKGSSVVLAFVIVGFMAGWIVPGPVYKESVKREERLEVKVDVAQSAATDAAQTAKEMLAFMKEHRGKG